MVEACLTQSLMKFQHLLATVEFHEHKELARKLIHPLNLLAVEDSLEYPTSKK